MRNWKTDDRSGICCDCGRQHWRMEQENVVGGQHLVQLSMLSVELTEWMSGEWKIAGNPTIFIGANSKFSFLKRILKEKSVQKLETMLKKAKNMHKKSKKCI